MLYLPMRNLVLFQFMIVLLLGHQSSNADECKKLWPKVGLDGYVHKVERLTSPSSLLTFPKDIVGGFEIWYPNEVDPIRERPILGKFRDVSPEFDPKKIWWIKKLAPDSGPGDSIFLLGKNDAPHWIVYIKDHVSTGGRAKFLSENLLWLDGWWSRIAHTEALVDLSSGRIVCTRDIDSSY
jgi:hypothetical protein